MNAGAKRSYTGAFGWGGTIVKRLEETAAEIERAAARRSPVPPTPLPPEPPPESEPEPTRPGRQP